ncbi:MAG: 23S rRNA (uracil(1939)-C(5))-methyltransferase RlmD [Dongiaceae bacterium]
MNKPIPALQPENQTYHIEKMVFGGWGLSRNDKGRPVFVAHSAENENITARIYKKAKGVLYAEGLDITAAPHPSRIAPRCVHTKACGGCSYQHVTSAQQLEWKERILAETFAGFPLQPAITSPQDFHYRNKMEYGLALDDAGQVRLGLHPRWRHQFILDLKECHLIQNSLWQIAERAKQAIQATLSSDLGGPKEFFWEHLTLRESFSSQRQLLMFEVKDPAHPVVKRVADILCAEFPSIAGISVRQRNFKANPVRGENCIEETINGVRLGYGVENFFQVNVPLLPNLLTEVMKIIAQTAPETIYDLFGGVGTFGITIAKAHPKIEVIGAESDGAAVALASQNAKLNGLKNYQSLGFDLYQKGWAKQLPEGFNPLLIIDPPRAGLTDKSINEMLGFNAKTIIYISCNPTTQKRDIDQFAKAGYQLESLRLIDMFPQTYHIESLAVLKLS